MDNFPLDQEGLQQLAKDLQNMGSAIMLHDSALRADVKALTALVQEALLFDEATDTIWKQDAEIFLKGLKKRELDHINSRFNQKNGHRSTIGMVSAQELPTEPISNFVDKLSSGDKHAMAKLEQELNLVESGFGEEMDEDALAKHFGEENSKPTKARLKKPLNKMSLKEIEDWEAEQDNSNDIYKISARIKNLARGNGHSLGPQQEMLCNTFCHVVKAYYDLAQTVVDKELKKKIVELTRLQEHVPATLIAAAVAGVNSGKK